MAVFLRFFVSGKLRTRTVQTDGQVRRVM